MITNKNKIILSASALVVAAGILSYIYRPASGLDGFATLTKQDPLFYSPFFDNEAFSSSVADLSASEKTLKKTALHNISLSKENYVDSYTELIKNNPLFPTDFLALLPNISEETDEFTAHPTAQKARELLSLYEQAQKAYEKDSKSMVDTYADIDKHVPADHPLYYFFTDSAMSVKTAESDFNLIHKNSLALKAEIDRRHDCLLGKGGCEAADQKAIAIPVATAGKASSNSSFIASTLPFASTTHEVNGPYQIASPCWSAGAVQPMYAIYSTTGNKTLMLPKLANESYYHLVSPKATDSISKKILSMGLQFYGQAEATTYECSDLTFYPQILTLDYIRNHASSSQDFTKLERNQFGLLAPAFESLSTFTDLLEASQRISNDFVLSPQFLFTTRSAYSLTYLPFAESVWRIKEKPAYLLSREAYEHLGAPQQFKTLTELRQEGFTDEEIEKSQINQIELIDSLVK